MAKRTIIPTLKAILNESETPYYFRGSDHYFSINGAQLDILSGHDPDNLKGPNYGWGGVDEPFIQKHEVFQFFLSRLRVPQSTMLELFLTGTPEQLDWGYEILDGKNKIPDANYIQVSSRTNLPEKTLQVLLNTYSSEMVEAYIDAGFVMLNTKAVYYNFSRLRNVKRLRYRRDLPLILSCDFNRAPMCWNVIQEIPVVLELADGRWPYFDTYVLDEIHIDGTNTYECLDEFISRWGTNGDNSVRHEGHICVSGDYSGSSLSSTIDTISNFDVIMLKLREHYGDNKISLELMPNPLRTTRHSQTNAELMNHKGECHLFFDEKCVHTIDDYSFASVKPGTRDIDKAHYDPHHSDAVDYRVWWKVNNAAINVTDVRLG